MSTMLPTETITAEYQWNHHDRMLQLAATHRLAFDADYATPDGLIVWNPSERGRCEVVEPTGCSCQHWRIWRRCPHAALYIETFGINEPQLEEGIAA